jgi:3-deoxy-7-phosphoheptulonate synthase
MSKGNPQIILCERGIRTTTNTTLNILDLCVVLSIKELSHLPISVDPSHAGTQSLYLEKFAQLMKEIKKFWGTF